MTKLLRAAVSCVSIVFLVPVLSRAQAPSQKPQPSASFMATPQTTAADQQNFPPLLLQQLSAIKAAALNDDYAYRQLSHLTENIGPRPTGSSQANAAAEYVAAEPRKLGLEVHLQPVTVPHWVRGAGNGGAGGISRDGSGHYTKNRSYGSWGSSGATPADGVTAEVVTVNTFDELNIWSREKVAGKICSLQRDFR